MTRRKHGTHRLRTLLTALALFVPACDEVEGSGQENGEDQAQCPAYLPEYTNCTVEFAAPDGPDIDIDGFVVMQEGANEFLFVAESNQGELPFPVIADGVVRLGQDQRVNPDGTLEFFRTHESSVCESDRIVGHQMVLLDGGEYEIQVLEFIRNEDELNFRLSTDGEPRADVVCMP